MGTRHIYWILTDLSFAVKGGKKTTGKKRGPLAMYSFLTLIVLMLQECTVRPSSHRRM
jgi:hypothetical protein